MDRASGCRCLRKRSRTFWSELGKATGMRPDAERLPVVRVARNICFYDFPGVYIAKKVK